MITMTIHPGDYTGAGKPKWRITCGPFDLTCRSSPICTMARKLVEAGYPDQPWQAVGLQDGGARMNGRSIHRLALLTVSESDRTAPRHVKWAPNPMAAEWET